MRHNGNNGHNSKLQILIQPNIGLDSDVRHSVVGILNHTLANEAVLTLKTRSAYWNVSGSGFFELHILFDSQYKQLSERGSWVGLLLAAFRNLSPTPGWRNSPGSFQTFCVF
jgi:hypothetical protein